jgi:DNA helicase-2/ATP-dependent DNA helicase PcrA
MSDDLDDEQVRAVDAPERVVAVLAGPGSGKTRTLSHRMWRLLRDHPGSRALALTFTNKAAAEMKTRALKLAAVSSDRIRAGTFHGFGAIFLRSQGALVGIDPDFEIIDPDEQKVFASAVDPGGASLVDRWGDSLLRDIEPSAIVARFGEAYERAKRSAAIVDFNDLVVHTSEILGANEEIARAYATRYPHILVDEFQDTNGAQFRIINALAPHAETVSVFADDDQAIFRFTGAERENIERFIDQLGATVYPLTCNYRCHEEIVSRANALIAADPNSSGRRMRAHHAGGTVVLKTSSSVNVEADVVATEIEQRVVAGQPARDIAVLVRSGFRANDLVAALRARRLPVTDWRGDTYQPRERRTFITVLSALRGNLNDRQARRLCELMQVDLAERCMTEDLLAAHEGHPVADELKKLRALAFSGASLIDIATQAQRAASAADTQAGDSLAPMVLAVADFQAHDPEFTLDDLLADLVLGGGGRPPTAGGGIKVATLHKTKGLEWPTVYLIGLEDDSLPGHWCEPDEIPEERRLCFVGVCRAERELIVTFAESYRGYPKRPSRFLREMGMHR